MVCGLQEWWCLSGLLCFLPLGPPSSGEWVRLKAVCKHLDLSQGWHWTKTRGLDCRGRYPFTHLHIALGEHVLLLLPQNKTTVRKPEQNAQEGGVMAIHGTLDNGKLQIGWPMETLSPSL